MSRRQQVYPGQPPGILCLRFRPNNPAPLQLTGWTPYASKIFPAQMATPVSITLPWGPLLHSIHAMDFARRVTHPGNCISYKATRTSPQHHWPDPHSTLTLSDHMIQHRCRWEEKGDVAREEGQVEAMEEEEEEKANREERGEAKEAIEEEEEEEAREENEAKEAIEEEEEEAREATESGEEEEEPRDEEWQVEALLEWHGGLDFGVVRFVFPDMLKHFSNAPRLLMYFFTLAQTTELFAMFFEASLETSM
ncbi:uncharacterized protein LOC142098513 [Mixophyes fleayi]|uniref:uncharacterized protein LOC142098513 n=1 Tax=Mixophyes fleayi TaxID=3061075 RepID=UPI003F4E2FFE